MKYSDGVEIRMGDRVRLHGMHNGVVVVSVDTDEYSDECAKNVWESELKSGVLVKCDEGALVHLDGTDPDPNAITRMR